jgi:hypothetical protein
MQSSSSSSDSAMQIVSLFFSQDYIGSFDFFDPFPFTLLGSARISASAAAALVSLILPLLFLFSLLSLRFLLPEFFDDFPRLLLVFTSNYSRASLSFLLLSSKACISFSIFPRLLTGSQDGSAISNYQNKTKKNIIQ